MSDFIAQENICTKKCWNFYFKKGLYRGCQITSPPVVSGGFVGQVKPRGGGSKNCGFALGFNPPPVVSGEFVGHVKPRGGEVI